MTFLDGLNGFDCFFFGFTVALPLYVTFALIIARTIGACSYRRRFFEDD